MPRYVLTGFNDVPQPHGSFFSFRLLCHHDRLLARTDSGCVQFVHECAVPTYRRKDKTDRGCVTFLFHTHPLTYSGSQVAHSVERTNLLISLSSLVYHTHTPPHVFNCIAFFPHNFSSHRMNPSDVVIVSYVLCVRDAPFV